jgi:hypothetical protein
MECGRIIPMHLKDKGSGRRVEGASIGIQWSWGRLCLLREFLSRQSHQKADGDGARLWVKGYGRGGMPPVVLVRLH